MMLIDLFGIDSKEVDGLCDDDHDMTIVIFPAGALFQLTAV
jgi:hypothetical protein